MTKVERTPITIKGQWTNLRTGRKETCYAVSTDGVWGYEREDGPGTPWVITHLPTGEWMYAPSLPKARAYTASGAAHRMLSLEDR